MSDYLLVVASSDFTTNAPETCTFYTGAGVHLTACHFHLAITAWVLPWTAILRFQACFPCIDTMHHDPGFLFYRYSPNLAQACQLPRPVLLRFVFCTAPRNAS
jgi:hypothetical protein